MTPMIQIQYQNQIQMQLQIQTLNWPQSQSHGHPVAWMGLEVKLEGPVLCGVLVCNSYSPIPNHDYRRGVSPQIRVALNVGQKVGTFDMQFMTVVIRKQTHQTFLLLFFTLGCTG